MTYPSLPWPDDQHERSPQPSLQGVNPPPQKVNPPALGLPQIFCYACSNPLDPRASVCPRCGVAQHRPGTSQARTSQGTSQAHPNAVLGLILNIFLPGVGTVILGQTGPRPDQHQTNIGIIQIVLILLSIPLDFIVIGFFLGLGVWVWALIISLQAFSNYTGSAEG